MQWLSTVFRTVSVREIDQSGRLIIYYNEGKTESLKMREFLYNMT